MRSFYLFHLFDCLKIKSLVCLSSFLQNYLNFMAFYFVDLAPLSFLVITINYLVWMCLHYFDYLDFLMVSWLFYCLKLFYFLTLCKVILPLASCTLFTIVLVLFLHLQFGCLSLYISYSFHFLFKVTPSFLFLTLD